MQGLIVTHSAMHACMNEAWSAAEGPVVAPGTAYQCHLCFRAGFNMEMRHQQFPAALACSLRNAACAAPSSAESMECESGSRFTRYFAEGLR
eukprot:scaffold204327_cov20-Tisochrysis_lutea.AAC.1